MAKQSSQFRQEAKALSAGLMNILDYLFLLPLFIVLVAVPIWWGYGFIKEHFLVSMIGVGCLILVACILAARRRLKS